MNHSKKKKKRPFQLYNTVRNLLNSKDKFSTPSLFFFFFFLLRFHLSTLVIFFFIKIQLTSNRVEQSPLSFYYIRFSVGPTIMDFHFSGKQYQCDAPSKFNVQRKNRKHSPIRTDLLQCTYVPLRWSRKTVWKKRRGLKSAISWSNGPTMTAISSVTKAVSFIREARSGLWIWPTLSFYLWNWPPRVGHSHFGQGYILGWILPSQALGSLHLGLQMGTRSSQYWRV